MAQNRVDKIESIQYVEFLKTSVIFRRLLETGVFKDLDEVSVLMAEENKKHQDAQVEQSGE